jgi:hypothetical protein
MSRSSIGARRGPIPVSQTSGKAHSQLTEGGSAKDAAGQVELTPVGSPEEGKSPLPLGVSLTPAEPAPRESRMHRFASALVAEMSKMYSAFKGEHDPQWARWRAEKLDQQLHAATVRGGSRYTLHEKAADAHHRLWNEELTRATGVPLEGGEFVGKPTKYDALAHSRAMMHRDIALELFNPFGERDLLFRHWPLDEYREMLKKNPIKPESLTSRDIRYWASKEPYSDQEIAKSRFPKELLLRNEITRAAAIAGRTRQARRVENFLAPSVEAAAARDGASPPIDPALFGEIARFLPTGTTIPDPPGKS